MSTIPVRLACVALIAACFLVFGPNIRAAHRFPAVIATIPVGFSFPLGLAVDSGSNRIYVTGGACCSAGPGGAVSIIDGATHAVVATIPVTAGAVYTAVNPLTNRLYVTHGNGPADIVTVIDTISNTAIATIPTGRSPFGIAVNPASNRVYVANNRGHSVSVIDGATNAIVTNIPMPVPLSVAIDAIANRLYVTSGTNVAVIDLSTNAVVDTIADRNDALAFGIGFDPLLNRLYVPRFTGELGGTVAVVDVAAKAVANSIAVGNQPNGVGVNPAANRVYVGVRSANAVAVIDSAADQRIGVVPVGLVPFDVAANPVTDRVYVANTHSHTVSVIADVFADLSVDISDTPDPVLPGHEVTYTSIVTNHGESAATGVTFDQVMQSQVGGAAQATSSQGTCTVSDSTVSCALGTIIVGASATVTVTVRVTRPGTITATASVVANEADSNTGNNSDTETTSVVPGPPNPQGRQR